MSNRPDMDGWQLVHQLEIPEATKTLNQWQRMHWGKRGRYKKRIAWLVRGQIKKMPRVALVKSRIHVTRGNPPPRPDHDGLIGGLKPLIDVLCSRRDRNKEGLGFIVDDSPQYLDTLTADSVTTRPGEGFTRVEIWQPNENEMRSAA